MSPISRLRRSNPLIASSNVDASLTGTLTETTQFSCVIPGGTIGPNGVLKVTLLWSLTNNANAKTLRVKFGGVSFLNASLPSQATVQMEYLIRNRNSASAQVSANGVGFNVYTSSGQPVVTSAINTLVDQTLAITGQLGVTGDNITLNSVLVQVLNP